MTEPTPADYGDATYREMAVTAAQEHRDAAYEAERMEQDLRELLSAVRAEADAAWIGANAGVALRSVADRLAGLLDTPDETPKDPPRCRCNPGGARSGMAHLSYCSAGLTGLMIPRPGEPMTDPTPTARDVIVAALTARHEELRGEASPRDFDGASQILAALDRAGYTVTRRDSVKVAPATWEDRLVTLVVPADAAPARRTEVAVALDAAIEYEGELDQTTTTYVEASVTGYGADGAYLWRYKRDYEDGVVALLNDLDNAEQIAAADELTRLGQEMNPEGHR